MHQGGASQGVEWVSSDLQEKSVYLKKGYTAEIIQAISCREGSTHTEIIIRSQAESENTRGLQDILVHFKEQTHVNVKEVTRHLGKISMRIRRGAPGSSQEFERPSFIRQQKMENPP